jgi:hypothetical protein
MWSGWKNEREEKNELEDMITTTKQSHHTNFCALLQMNFFSALIENLC